MIAVVAVIAVTFLVEMVSGWVEFGYSEMFAVEADGYTDVLAVEAD